MRFFSRERATPFSVFVLLVLVFALRPSSAYADFEGSLRNVKSELSNVVLPLLSVIGMLMAAFSYLTGNMNAKQHITYALIGAAIGFGSQAIIDFIQSTIH
jgi:TrbC/VIRB2 pilin